MYTSWLTGLYKLTEKYLKYISIMDTLKRIAKEPYVYVILIQIIIVLILVCPSFNPNKKQIVDSTITAPYAENETTTAKQSTENKGTTTIIHNPNKKQIVHSTITTPYAENEITAVKVSTENKNTTTITQIDGYYTIAKEQSYVYIQKRCNGCPKLYFNESQFLEIKRFLGSCFHETKCDTRGFATNNLYCIVCNPSLKMTLSSLSFCVDFNGNLNCAFQGSYIFYSDLLYAMYKFHN